jgi:hypothetical protein
MALFFRVILETRGIDSLHIWAVSNVLTACRRPQEAFERLQSSELSETGSEYYARHCGAYARALIPLNHPPETL